MATRIQEKYKSDVASALTKRFGYSNVMAVPKLSKIIVSMGLGENKDDKARFASTLEQLAQIVGQKPIIIKSKKAVSNFGLRQGMMVGMKVTLRGVRMFEFLDRLTTLAIPRVRDFRGLAPKGFDGRGNYNMGLNEQSVFPEVDPAKITFTQGMNITFVTTARSDEEALELLTLLGMPFRKD